MLDEILSGLNEKQRQAVVTTEGFVRIIAGAGSGKTKALTHRYAYLVKAAGIHPGNILCVTFTNKAAGEMKRRVRSLVGDGCDTSLITTYHGFCVRVLHEDIGRLFYPENFAIIGRPEQKKILEEIYGELDLKLDHASFENMLDKIEILKRQTFYVDLLLSRGKDSWEAQGTLDDQIMHRYLMRQKKIFALDYNDLINFVFVLFERFPEVREKWQKRLEYVQVDEFQDSSERELKLIDILSGRNQNLFVVGDPDQNIYEWRGAKVSILVEFDKTHPETQTVIMDQNYRSTERILKLANTLIAHNQMRVPKDLFTAGEPGDEVIHFHGKDEKEEIRLIVEEIRKLRTMYSFCYKEIAILYRSGFLSQAVEQAFLSEGIPYEIIGSAKFFDRMEIMDAVAYLRLCAYDDDQAFMRVINTPRRKFGKSKLTTLETLAQRDGIALFAALVKYREMEAFRQSRVGEFLDLILRLRRERSGMQVSEILQTLLVESGYETYIREAGNMERLDNLSELKKMTVDYEQSYGKVSPDDLMPADFLPLEAYLQQLALMKSSGAEEEEEKDRVRLMTIHAAKGLEFPVCFVIGMTDGVFPSSRTLEERKTAGLEEERRLCFVAVTRAMKRLYLTDSEGAGQGGRLKTPSRFLFDMGEENYVRIGVISKEARDQRNREGQTQASPVPSFQVGDSVQHAVFGRGEIVGIDDKRSVYEIRFESGAVKPIAMDYDFDLWRRLMGGKATDAAPVLSPPFPAESSRSCTNVMQKQQSVHNEAEASEDAETGGVPTFAPIADRHQPIVNPGGARASVEDMTLTAVAEAVGKKEDVPAPAWSLQALEPENASPVSALLTDDSEKKEADNVLVQQAVPKVEERAGQRPGVTSSKPFEPDYIEPWLPEIRDRAADHTVGGRAAESELPADKPIPGPTNGKKSAVSPGTQPDTRLANLRNRDGSSNLWENNSVPHHGWSCEGVVDLGSPTGVCGMCGKQIIRYVHIMKHEGVSGKIGAGCICAGKMEGNVEHARSRETQFKLREARRATFLSKKRRLSRNGHPYFKYKDKILTILQDARKPGYFKVICDGNVTKSYSTPEGALNEVFDRLDQEQDRI